MNYQQWDHNNCSGILIERSPKTTLENRLVYGKCIKHILSFTELRKAVRDVEFQDTVIEQSPILIEQ